MKHHRWRLVTLTHPRNDNSSIELIRETGKTFNRFMNNIRKKYKRIAYARAVELHEDDYPHIHLVVNRYIPIDFLVKQWKKQKGGSVDIKMPLDEKGRPKYSYRNAAKYLTEELEKVAQNPYRLGLDWWMSGTRSFSCSRTLSEHFPKSEWEFDEMVPTAEEAFHRVYDYTRFVRIYKDSSFDIRDTPNGLLAGYGVKSNIL